jgi:hypothetical protein
MLKSRKVIIFEKKVGESGEMWGIITIFEPEFEK